MWIKPDFTSFTAGNQNLTFKQFFVDYIPHSNTMQIGGKVFVLMTLILAF